MPGGCFGSACVTQTALALGTFLSSHHPHTIHIPILMFISMLLWEKLQEEKNGKRGSRQSAKPKPGAVWDGMVGCGSIKLTLKFKMGRCCSSCSSMTPKVLEIS